MLAHLEEVLASTSFSGARGQQRLLRYLVEHSLGADAAGVKEYSLGVEVFDRGPDFDPRLDPIVRVEASRLRARLHKYYEADGREAELRIDLPRGGYVPTWHLTQAEELATPAPEPVAEHATAPLAQLEVRRKWSVLSIAGLAALVVVVIGAAWWWRKSNADRPPAFGSFARLTRDQSRCTSPSLSPDGKRVVYARRQGAEWAIFIADAGGGEPRNLTPDSHANNRAPAFSPDGAQIAFRSDREGSGVFLMPAAGGPARRIAEGGHNPAWSPDGKQIAFGTETFREPGEDAPNRRGQLRIVDLASGQVRAVPTPGVVDAMQPAWSPHGDRIAFWGADAYGGIDLWTVPAAPASEPTAPVAVTQDPWIDWSPAWSRDGRFLYFSSDRGGAMNLWRARIDERSGAVEGAPEPLTTPSSNSGWTSFSADGSRFAYARRLIYSRMYRVGFDPRRAELTDTPVELTAGERRIREPDFSPDSAWVAARIQDPQDDIVLIRPDGSGMIRLTNDAFIDRAPAWSPDGASLVFVSNRNGRFGLWSIHPDGHDLRQLSASGAAHPVWLPDGSLAVFPSDRQPVAVDPPGRPLPAAALAIPDLLPIAWSPDGRWVAGWRTSGPAGHQPLTVCSTAGRDCWPLSDGGTTPIWLKDSRGLLFATRNEIRFADLAKRQTKPVFEPNGADLHAKFALSRDQRYLLFVEMRDSEDVWLASR